MYIANIIITLHNSSIYNLYNLKSESSVIFIAMKYLRGWVVMTFANFSLYRREHHSTLFMDKSRKLLRDLRNLCTSASNFIHAKLSFANVIGTGLFMANSIQDLL